MCPHAQVVGLRPIPPLTLELGKVKVWKEGSFDILRAKGRLCRGAEMGFSYVGGTEMGSSPPGRLKLSP